MSETKTVRAVCPHDCPDTCSMVVTVEDGRAVRLKGDTDHPFTDGFLCQKVNRYLERVYHPDRLKHPLLRTGPKGSGQFRRISWDEAIDTITAKFQAIAQSKDGPQAILPYSYCGTMGKLQGSSLDRRFFHRLGASLLDRTICATAGAAGCDITLGTRAVIDPDSVIHSRYIINWGSNTSVTNMHLWTIMHRARKAGAKIVTIDPYKCKTAQKSDWWIPIRPGTDAALALGIMHILWRDGLQDDDYLQKYCLGSEPLRERVLKEYPPKWVADVTGIPVADIEKLAHEYGTTRPALIRLNYGMQRHGGGGMAVRAITCLPAIIGDWRAVGGGALLSTSKLYPFDANMLERPDLIPAGTRTINMTQLAEALLGELPGPPVQAMYVYNSNPAAVCPDQSRVLKGMRREDLFTVVHDHFQTDTADYADIVLPATTQLEHFDIHSSYGHLYVQTNEPAIAPLHEAKSNNDVFRLLAKKMGFEPELFEIGDEQLAEESLSPGSGTAVPGHTKYPPPQAFLGISLDRLKREGPIRLNLPNNYMPFAQGNFGTSSGKCELYSPQLAKRGLDPLPNYTPPHEDPQTRPDLAAKYPLQMLSPPVPEFLNSTFVNVDSLREQAREPTLEIHPVDASPRGIAGGQWVRIFNDRGSFRARALVAETVKPGVVVSQSIWWNRYTPDGVNCNTTTSTALTDFGAGATFFDNLVEVAVLVQQRATK
jgi:anaerobic selenocysteine-containing dehydrogenase